MSDFGDFDSDDAVDTEPPDPEQVAMKLHQYRIDIGDRLLEWDRLPDEQQVVGVELMERLIALLLRQGAIS